jgi:CxxC motif-containing protein (DUF1111 family)
VDFGLLRTAWGCTTAITNNVTTNVITTRTLPFRFSGFLLLLLSACRDGGESSSGNEIRAQGDQPMIATHLDQAAIESGDVQVMDVLAHGRDLFASPFNDLDGAGRPMTTGTGADRGERGFPQNFNRFSAPDANSCGGCHNVPRLGGGGDNVANVFVLGQRFGFLNFDGLEGDNFEDHFLDGAANERNTLGMFGAGFIELLAREMTVELQAQRDAARQEALGSGLPVTVPLVAKGVPFGSLTADPAGNLDASAVEGVDGDLVVRPFHQKGVVVSLREFTNNAMNHHHGMQSVERFGAGDSDGDGHTAELTVGDITATTLWQATLPVPGRVLPNSPVALAAVASGEGLFDSLGCAVCHVPELVLEDPIFTEPSPFNPPGNLQLADVGRILEVDLTTAGQGPHLQREGDGTVRIQAYTDLKRHDMGPGLDNEQLVQAGVPTEQFLTRKLWGMSNEPPFMHHGRALTIDEAIRMHGGEAQAARDAYVALVDTDQKDVVEFLKTLQVLPPDASSTEVVGPASGILGDEPAVPVHLDQAQLEAGSLSPDALFAFGKELFGASFNTLDGAGRPETTGTGAPRLERTVPQNFNRISGPDSNSCAGCHNLPRQGGGGDNVANVFVMGQRFPFVNFDPSSEGDGFQVHTLEEVASERNTLGMFGSGYIELLAREMTAELHAQRDDAVAQAMGSGRPVTVDLVAKGVRFGSLTADPAGNLATDAVEGLDADLIVKPFHQKGVVVSLRQFSNNAMNHHHGMQAVERFGPGDPDNDGHTGELTVGDQTAVALYQAMLPVPGRVLPSDPALRASVDLGETLFTSSGCAECHVPFLRLESPIFSEPNPYNPSGNLQVADVSAPVEVDLTVAGPGPHLAREADGAVLVPAFTDLKRHDMGPELDNEHLVQDGVPTSQFLTRKLWGMANEPPFLHHGRCQTIDDAILKHGGEAQAARDAYVALSDAERRSVVDFLKTLQVVAENGPLETVE